MLFTYVRTNGTVLLIKNKRTYRYERKNITNKILFPKQDTLSGNFSMVITSGWSSRAYVRKQFLETRNSDWINSFKKQNNTKKLESNYITVLVRYYKYVLRY